MNMDFKEAADLLRTWDNILILTHRRPDGDTVGSAVGLCLSLRNLGKTAWLLENTDATPLFLGYMEGMVASADFSPDYVVSVDVAARSLFTDEGTVWLNRGIDLAIDHHPSYEGFAKVSCVDASRAACGELMYDIVRHLGEVTAEIALPLYVGVSTDCGCFVYGNTTADTHRVAAELMATGIDYRKVNKRHFRTKSLKRLQLESGMVAGMALHDGGKIAIADISLARMAELDASEEDAEDIAGFLGQIAGVETSVTIRETKDGRCKMSVRTSAGLSATKVCALLGGGGHAAASGCIVDGSITDARAAILNAIRTIQAQ